MIEDAINDDFFKHYYYGSAKDKPIIGNWGQFSAIRKRGGIDTYKQKSLKNGP
jgi:hypothetical protein